MSNIFKDDKIRAKIQMKNLVKREEAREISDQIDVHDLESTTEYLGNDYMSNVEADVTGARVFRIKNVISVIVIIACLIFFMFVLSVIL